MDKMAKRHLAHTLALAGMLALTAGACLPAAQPESGGRPTAPVSNTPPATNVPYQPCQGEPVHETPAYKLVEPGTEAELLWRPEFVPLWVRPSPDGRVLAVSDGGDTIYELKPDGTLAVAFHCPGQIIQTAVAASDGALWFSTRNYGRLYRVDGDGTISLIRPSANRYLEAGLDGSVYAMDMGLAHIQPDGSAKKITNAVNGRKFAIGPEGQIVALKDGDIVRISESGEITPIASDYGPEPWPTFGPDGLLYVTHWTGVDVIDLESGTITAIPWLENNNLAEAGAFAPDGRLLLYHPNTDVFAIDLAAQTVEVFHQVLGNSWAMAINPGEAVYIAFGNNLPNGETTIYRVVDEQTLERLTSVPYGIERSMAFDSQGRGYLGVADDMAGAAIFRFDPASGAYEEYHRSMCWPNSLVVDPQTDRVWWEECNRFVSLDEDGERVVREGVPGGENASLAITPAGAFYTVTFFHREDPGAPYRHGLYHWNEAGAAWEEVADLTQSDPGITLSMLVACPDDRIYTIESLDADHLPTHLSSSNAVRRLEPSGAFTVLGYDFSYDGLGVDCDPATGRIIFTSGAGIFALTPP